MTHKTLLVALMLATWACNADGPTRPSLPRPDGPALGIGVASRAWTPPSLLRTVCGTTFEVTNPSSLDVGFFWSVDQSPDTGFVSVGRRGSAYLAAPGAAQRSVRLFADPARTKALGSTAGEGTPCSTQPLSPPMRGLVTLGYVCGNMFVVRSRVPYPIHVDWVAVPSSGRTRLEVPASGVVLPSTLFFDAGTATRVQLFAGSQAIGSARVPSPRPSCSGGLFPIVYTSIAAGDGASEIVGDGVHVAPAVQVMDALDRPVAGALVDFAITGGRSRMLGTRAQTNANGVARLASWTLLSLGAHQATATVDAAFAGTAPLTFSATARNLNFFLQTGIPGENLGAVWGTAPTDLFSSGGHRTLNHWDGATWSAMTHPPGSAKFRIFGVGPNDVYSVGQWGAIRYDGVQWTTFLSTNEELFGVWAASPNEVFVSGDGTFYRWDGVTWTSIPTGLPTDFNNYRLENVWGTSASDVFVVGRKGTILHWNGTALASMSSGTSADLFDVFGFGANDVYVTGGNGLILHYDGAAWRSVPSGTPESLTGVWGSAPDNVYVSGLHGTLLRYDGQSWQSVPTGTSQNLWKLFGFGPTRLYITHEWTGSGALLWGTDQSTPPFP